MNIPLAPTLPFFLPPGKTLIHTDGRPKRLTFHTDIGGDWEHLKFVDDKGDLFKVQMPNGHEVFPSARWIAIQFAQGKLVDPDCKIDTVDDRLDRFLFLDRAACLERDPHSGYRFDWATSAIAAGIKKSQNALTTWIAQAPLPTPVLSTPSGRTKNKKKLTSTDLFQIALYAGRPKWRSLAGWMKKLEERGGRIGALVNCSGRLFGQSQLPPIVDRMVHHAAIETFVSGSENAFDAAARTYNMWHDAKDAGFEGLGTREPCAETVRRRMRRLENHKTISASKGRHVADKYFKGNGEPVRAERPFELVLIDGVTFEQCVLMAEDWEIPVPQMKAVIAMDWKTRFIFDTSAFSGPFRPETAIQTLMNVMAPPRRNDDEIADDPFFDLIGQPPSTILFDNDRAILPPGLVPGMVNLVGVTNLAKSFGPNDKAPLESCFKMLKRDLRDIKGRIHGPGFRRDPRIDPITTTNVTASQFRQRVRRWIRWWNNSPKRHLDGFSPLQLMKSYLVEVGPKLLDREELQRQLAHTPADKVLLTTNGFEFDSIHYRHNPDAVTEILNRCNRNTPNSKRSDHTAKAYGSIRLYHGNLDFVDFYDGERYHRFYSDEPDYTDGLTHWEHQQYREMLSHGAGGRGTRRDRMQARGEYLRDLDKDMPQVALRRRGAMAALLDCEETRRAAGKLGKSEHMALPPDIAITIGVGGVDRIDEPAPPPQPAPIAKGSPAKHKAPQRPDDYGMSPSARRDKQHSLDSAAELKASWSTDDDDYEGDEA